VIRLSAGHIVCAGAAALWLAGCDGRAGEAIPADVGPVASAAEAPRDREARRAEVLAEVAALGLDRVEVGDPDGLGALDADGPPAPPLEPSPLDLRRDTPEAALESVLGAIAAGDPAALAALTEAPGAALDGDDAAAARRRFLGPQTRTYWDRIAQALAEGAYETLSEGPDAAVVRVHVGGAAGSYRLRLQREGDAWLLAG